MEWTEILQIIANFASCFAFISVGTGIIHYLLNLPAKRRFPLSVTVKEKQYIKGNNFYTVDVDIKLINKTNRRDYVYGCEILFGTKSIPLYRLLNNQRNTTNLLENIPVEPNAPLMLHGFFRVNYDFEMPKDYSVVIKLQKKTFIYDFSLN